MTEQGDVWAVVSTFRPGEKLVAVVEAVLPQVARVVVVDDGSGPTYDEVLSRAAAAGAHIVRTAENAGIAAALNRGVSLALAAGAEAVLTLDQDSSVPAGLVEALARAGAAARRDGVRVGAIVPEWFADIRQARGTGSASYTDAVRVIQSGMLLPADVLRRVGDFREDFFIDSVDTEYELRLEAAGLAVIGARGTKLGHELGARYRRPLLKRCHVLATVPSVMTLSAPFRYYYRLRNRLVLTRLYFRAHPARMLGAAVWEGLHFMEAMAVASPRKDFARVLRAAVYAARHRRMGRMPDSVAQLAAGVRWIAVPLAAESAEDG